MNYFQSPHDDERQFNFPGFFNDIFNGPQGGQNFGPPGQTGGGPPFGGPPGQYGGGQPGFPGGPSSAGPPDSPPPSFTPQKPQTQQAKGGYGVFAIDPGAIQGCLYRFTYIWLRWDSFWFYPIYVGRRSISGFRWHRNRWAYYGVDLDNVESFQCY